MRLSWKVASGDAPEFKSHPLPSIYWLNLGFVKGWLRME